MRAPVTRLISRWGLNRAGGGGCLDFSRDFLGIQNNLKICGSARVSRPCSSANKVQPNRVQHVISFLNAFWKFPRLGNSTWDFCVVNFRSRDFFLDFFGSPRDFFGFWFLFLFDRVRHLKSGVTPWGYAWLLFTPPNGELAHRLGFRSEIAQLQPLLNRSSSEIRIIFL